MLGDSPSPTPPAEPAKTGLGRPKTVEKEITKTSQIGTREDETRATFIVNESQLEKMKAIAYWDRIQIKDVVANALADYIEKYEQKHGPVQSIPSRSK